MLANFPHSVFSDQFFIFEIDGQISKGNDRRVRYRGRVVDYFFNENGESLFLAELGAQIRRGNEMVSRHILNNSDTSLIDLKNFNNE